MTLEEFSSLFRSANSFSVNMLKDKTPRTLCLGFEKNRTETHLYLNKNGDMIYVNYKPNGKTLYVENIGRETDDIERYLPSLSAYPDSTDYEFAKKVFNLMNFHTYRSNRKPDGGFYGRTIDSVIKNGGMQ